MAAIKGNNIEEARNLVTRGVDIDFRGRHGETPLMKSLLCEDQRISRMLLDAGADADLGTRNGYSPLAFSCLQNNFEHARMLLNHKASLNLKTKEGWTALHFASTNPSVFFDNLESDFYRKMMELVYRYAHYHPDFNPVHIVRILLASGADPDDSDKCGMSPLMAAAGTGNHQILRLLLSSGAAVSLRDTEGKSALMYAASATIEELINGFIHLRLVGSTITSSDFLTPAMVARLRPQFEPQKEFCVHELIQGGADVNDRDRKGMTPVVYAARAGSLAVARNLIANGADIHARSQQGITPLYAAAINGHDEIIDYFIGEGLEVDTRLNNGETPLMAAVWNGKVSTVNLLIRHGADVNAKKFTSYREAGESPAFRDARNRHGEKSENYDEIFRLLAAAGAV